MSYNKFTNFIERVEKHINSGVWWNSEQILPFTPLIYKGFVSPFPETLGNVVPTNFTDFIFLSHNGSFRLNLNAPNVDDLGYNDDTKNHVVLKVNETHLNGLGINSDIHELNHSMFRLPAVMFYMADVVIYETDIKEVKHINIMKNRFTIHKGVYKVSTHTVPNKIKYVNPLFAE